MRTILAVAVLAITAGCGANAGIIERACLGSERGGSQTQVCGCIQDVANATLSPRDQRVAAKFFDDPHRAQEMRTSSSSDDGAFWSRWRDFGEAAEGYCS